MEVEEEVSEEDSKRRTEGLAVLVLLLVPMLLLARVIGWNAWANARRVVVTVKGSN